MNRSTLRTARQRGFTIVELMVGLVIGLIAILVMMQVFSVSEGMKRTTSGSSDAQVSGAITMVGLQRELYQAGHGITSRQLLGCSLTVPGGWTIGTLAPFVINPQAVGPTPAIPAGDANTDVIQIAFSNTFGAPEGDLIVSQPSATAFDVATPSNFLANDLVIAAPPLPRGAACNLRMEPATAVGALTVNVATGTGGVANGSLFNMGNLVAGNPPQVLVYAVRNGNLTQCDYMVNDCSSAASVGNPAIWVPIGADVVALRAIYGRDTVGTPGTGALTWDLTLPTTDCTWMRTTGARIAVVTRSGAFEKPEVDATVPAGFRFATEAANEPGWTQQALAPIDVKLAPIPAPATWQWFRYRTYETTIPLRNTNWIAGGSGC